MRKLEVIPINEFLDLLCDLGIREKDGREMLSISRGQFSNWKKKGTMPKEHYWAFQKEIATFLQKQLIKKLVRIGLVDKEFIRNLLD